MSDHSAAGALRRKLLPRTLRHATENVALYRSLYDGLPWDRVESAADLRHLPLTNKTLVRSEWHRAICPGLTLAHVQHTTGTTGESLIILRSVEEQRFIHDFLSETAKQPHTRMAAMVLEEAHHGASTGLPSPFQIVKGAITDDRAIETSLRLLDLPGEIPDLLAPIKVLIGTDTTIRALSHLAGMQLSDPGAVGIVAIHTYGDLLPSKIRRRIESVWGAPVIDRYSMVENFGGASLLPGSDVYAFDPHIQPEVLDPVTRAPITAGRGVLALTSLYPFVQMMPMIRYDTADVVDIVSGGPDYTDLKVRVLGRLGDCVCDTGGVPVLTPLEWREALEDIPGLVFHTRRRDLSLEGIAGAIGRPLVGFASEGGRIVGEITVTDDADGPAVCDAARAAILNQAPLLAERVRNGQMELRLTALGKRAFLNRPG